MHSDASSPVDDIRTENECQEASQLSQAKKQRASSLQPSSNTSINKLSTQPSAGTLTRQFQSSPPRGSGTMLAPIEVDEHTPKPTRRILFPSPKQTKDQRALGDTSSNPDKQSKDINFKADHTHLPDDDQADKENRPPTPKEDQAFDDLFDDYHQSMTRPTTPTPSNMIDPEMFKTPGNLVTPNRHLAHTGDFFSSAAKALFQPTTPIRTLSKTQQTESIGELTPFSLHAAQVLSEANIENPATFDFPALPSFDNSLNPHTQPDFDFSGFDPEDLLSTDMPIPSSPSWFGVYEDPMENSGDLWRDYQLPTSPEKIKLPEAEEMQRSVLDEKLAREEFSTLMDEGAA